MDSGQRGRFWGCLPYSKDVIMHLYYCHRPFGTHGTECQIEERFLTEISPNRRSDVEDIGRA